MTLFTQDKKAQTLFTRTKMDIFITLTMSFLRHRN